MNKLIPALSTALLLAALPSTQPLQASTAIQRCAMPDGGVAYSDRPCAALGGTTVAIPDDVMTRLAASAPAVDDTARAARPARAAMAVPRRSTAAGCARTPMQLEADLRGAFTLGEANRIAESWHWVGMSNAQGQQVMNRLQALGERPLVEAHYFDARIASLSMESALASSDPTWQPAGLRSTGGAGMLQLRFDGKAPLVLDLKVERFAGCYFVRF